MNAERPDDTVRAFVALELDATSLRRVTRISDRLRMASGAPSAAWTAPAKLHLTVKFAPKLPSAAIAALGQGLAPLADGRPAPRSGALRLDAFPSPEAAQVVVVALGDPEGEIAKLAARTEKLAAKLGVDRETRTFRPHVTLARLKRAYDARRWLRPDLVEGVGECRFARLALIRSYLSDTGSRYVPLAQFEFAAHASA
jgi:2'-5' RNA ligase